MVQKLLMDLRFQWKLKELQPRQTMWMAVPPKAQIAREPMLLQRSDRLGTDHIVPVHNQDWDHSNFSKANDCAHHGCSLQKIPPSLFITILLFSKADVAIHIRQLPLFLEKKKLINS